MPAAKTARTAAAGDAGKQPTPQEAHLFFAIIKNMKGKPEVDWAAVAADSGFKNAETAKVSSRFVCYLPLSSLHCHQPNTSSPPFISSNTDTISS